MSNDSASSYHLGTSDAELQRLGYQHQVWQEFTEKLWRLAGFDWGDELLDLGCGPGFTTLELARRVGPHGRVVGLDASRRFLDQLQSQAESARLTQIETVAGDACETELPSDGFDGAFCRWLMCFLPQPEFACRELFRLLRPGAKLVIWDYINYRAANVFPERTAIRRLFGAYYQSALNHGGSYDVGGNLPRILQHEGFKVLHTLPIQRLVRPGEPTWHWVSLFHEGYLPRLEEVGLLTSTEADEFRREWAAAENDPASLFFSPPMVGIIAEKPKQPVHL